MTLVQYRWYNCCKGRKSQGSKVKVPIRRKDQRVYYKWLWLLLIIILIYILLSFNIDFGFNEHLANVSSVPAQTIHTIVPAKTIHKLEDNESVSAEIIHKIELNESVPAETIEQIELNESIQVESCFDTDNCNIIPDQYRDCILNIANMTKSNIANTECKLPHGKSFIVNKILGHGTRATAFSVMLDNEYYAIKVGLVGIYCRHLAEEYVFLQRLNEYDINNNLGLNVGYLHPSMPYYYFRNYPIKDDCVCIIFMKQIMNPITLEKEMQKDKYSLQEQSVNNLLTFTVSCYNDISNIISAINDLNVYYQDLNEGNILFNPTQNKCYLIDFGGLIHLTHTGLLTMKPWHRKIYCILEACSPYIYYYLFTTRLRINTTKHLKLQHPTFTDGEILNILVDYAKVSNKYRLAQVFLGHFMQVYRFKNTAKPERKRKRSEWTTEEKLQFVWCERHKQIDALTQDLNHYTIDMDILNNFWEITHVFDIDKQFINESICSQYDNVKLNV